jgi:hypothetical protein
LGEVNLVADAGAAVPLPAAGLAPAARPPPAQQVRPARAPRAPRAARAAVKALRPLKGRPSSIKPGRAFGPLAHPARVVVKPLRPWSNHCGQIPPPGPWSNHCGQIAPPGAPRVA